MVVHLLVDKCLSGAVPAGVLFGLAVAYLNRNTHCITLVDVLALGDPLLVDLLLNAPFFQQFVELVGGHAKVERNLRHGERFITQKHIVGVLGGGLELGIFLFELLRAILFPRNDALRYNQRFRKCQLRRFRFGRGQLLLHLVKGLDVLQFPVKRFITSKTKGEQGEPVAVHQVHGVQLSSVFKRGFVKH